MAENLPRFVSSIHVENSNISHGKTVSVGVVTLATTTAPIEIGGENISVTSTEVEATLGFARVGGTSITGHNNETLSTVNGYKVSGGVGLPVPPTARAVIKNANIDFDASVQLEFTHVTYSSASHGQIEAFGGDPDTVHRVQIIQQSTALKVIPPQISSVQK